jgi:hypothetical protein
MIMMPMTMPAPVMLKPGRFGMIVALQQRRYEQQAK